MYFEQDVKITDDSIFYIERVRNGKNSFFNKTTTIKVGDRCEDGTIYTMDTHMEVRRLYEQERRNEVDAAKNTWPYDPDDEEIQEMVFKTRGTADSAEDEFFLEGQILYIDKHSFEKKVTHDRNLARVLTAFYQLPSEKQTVLLERTKKQPTPYRAIAEQLEISAATAYRWEKAGLNFIRESVGSFTDYEIKASLYFLFR